MFTRVFVTAFACLAVTTSSFAPAPVPETAGGVPIPQEKGYFVEEISKGLY